MSARQNRERRSSAQMSPVKARKQREIGLRTAKADLDVLWTYNLVQEGLLVFAQLNADELGRRRRLESGEGLLALGRRLAAFGRAGRDLLHELVRRICGGGQGGGTGKYECMCCGRRALHGA